MIYSKKLYGIEYLSNKEQEESNIYKLEYYKIKEEKYGIEIIQKYTNEKTENREINGIEQNEEQIDNLLNMLKRNKVTLGEVEYILEDLNYNSIKMV